MFPFLIGLFGTGWLSDLLKRRDEYRLGIMEKYTDRKVSEWLIKHIVNAEGYREKAYYATQKELLKKQFTIGCGTSYLFNGDGTPYITNHPYIGLNGVRLSDNLTALKKSMGYNNLTSKDFAVRLVRNYLVGNGTSGFIMLSIMENMKVRYSERVKDAMLEWSYGSGSAHKSIRGDYKDKYAYLNRTKEFNDFVNSFILYDDGLIASNYAYLRYRYYIINAKNQWQEAKFAWMARVYSCAMHIKGIEVSNPLKSLGFAGQKTPAQKQKSMANYEAVFKRDLGISISMA